jgi:hypothetical protein
MNRLSIGEKHLSGLSKPGRERFRLTKPRADIDHREMTILLQRQGRKTLTTDTGQQCAAVLDVAIRVGAYEG